MDGGLGEAERPRLAIRFAAVADRGDPECVFAPEAEEEAVVAAAEAKAGEGRLESLQVAGTSGDQITGPGRGSWLILAGSPDQAELAKDFVVGHTFAPLKRGASTVQGSRRFGCYIVAFLRNAIEQGREGFRNSGQNFDYLGNGRELRWPQPAEQMMDVLSVHDASSLMSFIVGPRGQAVRRAHGESEGGHSFFLASWLASRATRASEAVPPFWPPETRTSGVRRMPLSAREVKIWRRP